MQVKTFEAETMNEAIQLVKAEFGPNAMIVTASEFTKKKFFGLIKRKMVRMTAAAGPPVPQRNAYLDTMHEARSRREKPEPSTHEEFMNSMIAPLARQVRELKGMVESISEKAVPAQRTIEAVSPAENHETAVAEESAPSISPRIHKEDLEELKKYLLSSLAREKDELVAQVSLADHPEPVTAATTNENMLPIIQALRTHGVDEEILGRVIAELEPIAMRTSSASEIIKHTKIILTRLVKCAPPAKIKKGGKPKVIALVGPTGVGKTTTTAKIAAMYVTKKEAKVAFIASDTFRIGAVEQLKTYSDILKAPIEVAANSDDVLAAIEKHSDKDLVIIDTVGTSPNDLEKLTEIKALLHLDNGFEIHLCMSASTKDAELNRIVSRFNMLPLSRVIFTKLDEAETFGCIVNTHVRHKLQLSYFTNGQQVPQHIEAATAKKIVDLLMADLSAEEATVEMKRVG